MKNKIIYNFKTSIFKALKALFTLSECLSNVLITGESNFDERNGQEVHSERNNFHPFAIDRIFYNFFACRMTMTGVLPIGVITL
jgi:hypothetical protein